LSAWLEASLSVTVLPKRQYAHGVTGETSATRVGDFQGGGAF
jgi:hypothetical protein